MGKQSAINLDVGDTNSDGFDLAGGTTKRKLTITGSNIVVTGSGTTIYTYPSTAQTLVGRTSVDTLTNKTLTLPVIGDFTNATHDHSSAAQGGLWRQDLRVTSNFNTSSTTFVVVTGLSLTLAASEVWNFYASLNTTVNTGTAGYKLAIAAPSGAVVEAQVFSSLNGSTTNRFDRLSALGTVGGSTNGTAATGTAAADNFAYMSGTVVNSTNAGTMDILLLKITSNQATVYANSYISGRKMA